MLRGRSFALLVSLVLVLSVAPAGTFLTGPGAPAEAAPLADPTLNVHVHTNGKVRLTGRTSTRSASLRVERYLVSGGQYVPMQTVRSEDYTFSVLLDARTVRTIYLVADLSAGKRSRMLSVEPSLAAPTLSLYVHSNGKVRLTGRTSTRSATLRVERYLVNGRRYVPMRTFQSSDYRFSELLDARTVRTIYLVRDLALKKRSGLHGVNPRFDDCGLKPVKPDGSLWECSFVDEFNGISLDTAKWHVQTEGFKSGTAPETGACYRANNVSVSGGSLKLKARYATLLECPGLTNILNIFTSGMVSTYYKWSQRYGKFEARIRNTATNKKGLQESYWLFPDVREVVNNWPYSGEIDISETYSSHPNLSIPFLHSKYDAYGNITTGKYANTAYDCLANRGDWNTYRLEWSASTIEIHVNDKLCLVNTSGDAAFQHKYIMAFTQLLGSKGNEFNILNPPPMPATMEVDYARVWE